MLDYDADSDAADSQDQAETFDETHLTPDGEDIANFDDIQDVYDVTQRRGDASDAEALEIDEADFDAEALGDEELEEDDFDPAIRIKTGNDGDGFDEDRPGDDDVEGSDQIGDADLVEGGEDDFTDFQSKGLSDDDLKDLGYMAAEHAKSSSDADSHGPHDVEDTRDPKTEKKIDKSVEDTVPASDPPSASPGAD